MSVKQKIAQMLLCTPSVKNFEKDVKVLIEECQIGGIVLYSKHYQNYQEMLEKVNYIKQCSKKISTPVWIAIDQEGGRVNRFPEEVKNIKNARSIGKTKNIHLAEEMGKITGEMLGNTGIHMNFAPVLDIEHYEENTSIGNRAYGKDKNTVISMGISVMQAMQKQNIIAVPKHFPGHGLSKVDSHFFIPRITEKEEILRREELTPFAIAIQQGADAMMLGHLLIEAWDTKTPASLSEYIVTHILKNELNFTGLVITDDLKMLAIRLMYSMEEAVSKAIMAGNDSIVLGLETNKILSIIEKIEKRINKGIISLEKVEKSVHKIIQMKQKYKIENEPAKRNEYRRNKS